MTGAETAIAAAGLHARCRAAGGDFFQSVPAGGDAYMMKHILHDWDDARCLTILRHCRAALRDNGGQANDGALLAIEMVVPETNEPHPAKLLDLEMLAIAGGKERTETEFRTLFADAGFQLKSITPTKSPVCVIEAVPV
ncbi:MAG: methyltransferase [Pirellulales bacterium]